jgi:hypothetical protein
MKKILLLITILSTGFVSAQSFNGKGDKKLQIGANLQEFASGINASFDYGLAENISVGLSSSYALNVSNNIDADFINRFDIKARLNANLGNALNISDAFDVYPGLSLSTKNFGGHIGVRYFLTDGLGVYSEFNTTLARYSNVIKPAEVIHNQFTVNVGLCFNL